MKIIAPQAAHDATIYKDGKVTSTLIGNDDYIIQVKLDGARYIAQWDDNGIFHFTSRHISVKTGLPVIKTEHAKKLFAFRDSKEMAGTIIDGEVVCFGNDFNETVGDMAAGSHSSQVNKVMLSGIEKLDEVIKEMEQGKYRIEYHSYDLLAHDGIDYREKHQIERSCVLLKAIVDIKDNFAGVVVDVSNWDNTQESLDTILEYGYEGIILKHKKGPYQEGKRSKDWQKVKKLITEDAIILGGVEGNGKYQGTLGALIIGQYIGKDLVEVGTISGMDDATRKYYWDWLMKMKLETWADWGSKNDIVLGEQNYEKYPETLKIVEFIAQEATKSRYRHPRYLQERLDKNYLECTFNH